MATRAQIDRAMSSDKPAAIRGMGRDLAVWKPQEAADIARAEAETYSAALTIAELATDKAQRKELLDQLIWRDMPRGTCATCGRTDVLIRPDGLLIVHRRPTRRARCPGGHKAPKE